MYSLVNLIIALIIGGAIGSLIGWYSALASRGDNKRKIILELESQLDQARQNKVDYEAEVTEHYRSVYTHLANGADQLCGDQISMSEPALSAPPHDETDKPQLVEVAQPLDYAPKKPDEQGQLSETFGLEKSDSSAA